MGKNNIPEAIGIIVSLSGVAVMIGWFLGIQVLKSILPFMESRAPWRCIPRFFLS